MYVTPTLTRDRGTSASQPDPPYLNDVKTIQMWGLYEGSLAGFAVTVVLAFGGPFITAIAKEAAMAENPNCDPDVDSLTDGVEPCYVVVAGLSILHTSVFSFATSLSVIMQVLLLPMFAGLADLGSRNAIFSGATYIGCIFTALMSVSSRSNLMWGFAASCFIVANVACGVCVVLLNAFLPDIASSANRDHVSSWAHAFGFTSGVVLILVNIGLLEAISQISIGQTVATTVPDNNETPGDDDSDMGIRALFVLAAVWWFGFSFFPLRRLPNAHENKKPIRSDWACLVGYSQFAQSVMLMFRVPQTALYLISNMFYSDGLWTVALIMSTFGQQELGMSEKMLGISVLCFQIFAVVGCLLFERIARRLSTKPAIIITLLIFVFLCFYSLVALRTVPEFYCVVSLGAVALGGCSALSRSFFSRLIPKGAEADFFSIYEITDRGTAWLGPLVFGIVNQLTSSMRLGIISLVVFFGVGLACFAMVDVDKAILDAAEAVEASGYNELDEDGPSRNTQTEPTSAAL